MPSIMLSVVIPLSCSEILTEYPMEVLCLDIGMAKYFLFVQRQLFLALNLAEAQHTLHAYRKCYSFVTRAKNAVLFSVS